MPSDEKVRIGIIGGFSTKAHVMKSTGNLSSFQLLQLQSKMAIAISDEWTDVTIR